MASFQIGDFFLLYIPKLKRFYLKKIQRNDTKTFRHRKDNILAWFYTTLTIVIFLLIIGIILHFGAIYKIPIIMNIANFWGVKYLTGVEKFEVDIESDLITTLKQTNNISFIVDSPEEATAHFSIYFKTYQPNDFIPSYNYEKTKILPRGKTKIIVNVKPSNKGKFEFCIGIDDRSFFSINKYDKCPSTLTVE